MIVDSHVHYGAGHPVEELLDEATKAGVDQVVQVTAGVSGWDNSESFKGAQDNPDRVTGVIGRFDPIAPDIDNRMRAYAAQPNVLGIRITWHSQKKGEDWLGNRDLDAFFKACEKFDVAAQMNMPYQSKVMKETARRFPGVRFLIDHMFIRIYDDRDNKDIYREWPDLLKLAEEPNAYVKVSYFPEATTPFEKFPYPLGQKYFKELYDHVGPAKLLWGSNFPPVQRACTYRQALEFVTDHCNFLSANDKKAILGENYLAGFGPNRKNKRS